MRAAGGRRTCTREDGMPRDLYSTVAQMLPVLLLALVWESRYLERISGEQRRSRREDPVDGVRFWTKRRVRLYALFVATVVLGDTGLCVLMLAGTIPDSSVLRGVVISGVLLAVASLLFRMWVDILDATRPSDTGTGD